MAWDVLNQAFPQSHVEAPVVPTPDNTAAKLTQAGGESTARLIAAGTDTAIGAFIRSAIARKDAELEAQKLVQNAALTLNAQRIAEESSKRNYELTSQHYGVMETVAQGRSRALGDAMGAQEQIALLQDDVAKRANELKVLDPKFQTEHPVQFAANLNQLMQEYPQAPSYTGIPDKFKQLQAIADEQKVNLKYGAVKDPLSGELSGGKDALKPIWQVVRDLYDPNKRDATIGALEAAGHVQVNPVDETVTTPRTGPLGYILGPKKTTKTRQQREWDPLMNEVLKQRYQFNQGENRMKDIVPKRTLPQAIKYGQDMYEGTTPQGQLDSTAPLPEPEIPVEPGDITGATSGYPDQSSIIEFARKAIAQGAPFPAVAERLKSMSIDPNQIWGA